MESTEEYGARKVSGADFESAPDNIIVQSDKANRLFATGPFVVLRDAYDDHDDNDA